MVDIIPTADKLHIEVKGTHKLWSLRSRLEIPLAHIVGVHVDPKPAMGWFQGLKIAGADLPNIFRAGLFFQEGNKVFWDVRHPKKTIVIELEDESFAKLIVEVKDPAEAVAMIEAAIRAYQDERAAAEDELERSLRESLAEAGFDEAPDEPLRQRLT